ncbi:unnamed protein product [Rhodiola kirilowii]
MMLGIEDILCELASEETTGHGFPPGFRFHPTDEELITFYLASKVFHVSFCPVDIAEVDLNKCEPWDLPDVAKMGNREWYFYSLRDRKYPTGLRTNRATSTGYWKATGKDKEIHNAATGALIGMKKTLVFYLGRAPRGQKTKWVMHEYRLHGDFSLRAAAKEEWVICRICHKPGEKKNMILNEIGPQAEPDLAQMTSFMAINESFLPQLIDSQLMSDTFLQNQASIFPADYASNEDNHRTPHVYHNIPLQSKLGPIIGYNLQPESYYSASDTGVNPSTSLSSMLIKSLISGEDKNHNLKLAKSFAFAPDQQVKTESNYPYLLPGADDLDWFHEFQKASSQYNNHNPLFADANGGESCSSYVPQMSTSMDLSGRGCLQMVVDPQVQNPNW